MFFFTACLSWYLTLTSVTFLRFLLEMGTNKSSGGILSYPPPAPSPHHHHSSAHVHLRQLVWEYVDGPNGSPWMAVGTWQCGSTCSWLLFSSPSCLFGRPLLPRLQPLCCFTLRQYGIPSSFVLRFHNTAAAVQPFTTAACLIILVPAPDFFFFFCTNLKSLCFGRLWNNDFWWQTALILLMRFYSLIILDTVTPGNVQLMSVCNGSQGDEMGWCGCLIRCKDWVETIKDGHTAVPLCTSFDSVTMKEW